MARIFINYRRDDSAGYAGRLSDHLTQHFGSDEIFRDIEHIAPGLDFVDSIERAVGSCDVLIAMIGRQWLTLADEHGARRLDNPNDFVRLEIEAALQRNIRVIPVLVQGARMPAEEELPESLRGLARRNALELHDTSWSSDAERLIAVLEQALYAPDSAATRRLQYEASASRRTAPPRVSSTEPERGPVRSGHRRTGLALAVSVVVLLGLGGTVGVWALRRGASIGGVGTPTPVSSGSASASDRSTPAPDPEHNPIRLAAAGEVTAGEATYTLVSAQLDQPGGTDVALRLVLRMTSHARFPVNFWSQSARLLVGQVPYAPTEAPNDVVEGNSAKEDTFAFRIPKTTRQVVLQVGEIGHENATLPIDLSAKATGAGGTTSTASSAPDPEHYPIRLAAAGEVTAGEATYTLVSAQLDQPGGTDVALRLVLRMTSHARFPVNFWSQSARLLVGQVPYAPTEAPNDVVEGNSAKEDTFAFRIPKTTRQVVLQVGEIGHENATLPIDLGATKP